MKRSKPRKRKKYELVQQSQHGQYGDRWPRVIIRGQHWAVANSNGETGAHSEELTNVERTARRWGDLLWLDVYREVDA